jgi:hypothetical protein
MNHFAIAEHMQTQRRLDEVEAKSIEGTTSATDHSPPIAIINEPISDLCQAISDHVPVAGTFLGYLPDEKKNSYEFHIHSSVPTDGETRTLSQILEANALKPYLFPSEKRAVVAAVLASSILQLQETYWLSRLDKKDIFFVLVRVSCFFLYVSRGMLPLLRISFCTLSSRSNSFRLSHNFSTLGEG